MYFMTYHGTFLCLDATSRIVHRTAAELHNIDSLLDLDILVDSENDRFKACMTLQSHASTSIIANGPLIGHVVHIQADQRRAAISFGGRYLCAIPGQEWVEADRDVANDWELFVCLTRQDIEDILFITVNDWIFVDNRKIIRANTIILTEPYQLLIGHIRVDLRNNMPFLSPQREAGAPLLSIQLLEDGWRIAQVFLYKPMIFLTAYRAPQYLEQAALCISSLIEFDAYRGAIHVLSDQPAEIFYAAVPSLVPGQLTVQSIAAEDWVGYVASKYCILDWHAAQNHQPLLFLDPDIMADANLEPLLATIATSPRIMAPMEEFSPLSHNPSVGASLIQRAGHAPRFAHGFNGGTLGIPNLREHDTTLRLIRRIIANHAALHGRESFRWVDQEVANYVSFVVGGFDTASLLRYVRFGWEGCEFLADQRIGLVHFFPPRGPISKNEAMRTYTHTLRAANAAQ